MSEELIIVHHGIKGQRWGVKNGPPYPLDNSQKSSAEKRLEKEDSSDNSQRRVSSQPQMESETSLQSAYKNVQNFYKAHEKEIKLGAEIAAASLAMYGAYKLYKTMPANHLGIDTYATSEPLINVLSQYRDKPSVIPGGTAFKRISKDAIADYENVGSAYVSYKLRDTARYVSDSSNNFSFPGGTRNYIHTLKSTKSIKVPSAREMAEIYLQQHPKATDQQFRSMLTYGFVQWNSEDESDPVISAYKKQAASYRDEVISRGYGAIVDLEDAGKQVQSPLILLSLDGFDAKSSKIKEYERVVSNLIKRDS